MSQRTQDYDKYRKPTMNGPDEMRITQAGGDGEPVNRTKDFNLEELFGGPVKRIAPDWYSCIECGACVRYTITHTAWHNKLLP